MHLCYPVAHCLQVQLSRHRQEDVVLRVKVFIRPIFAVLLILIIVLSIIPVTDLDWLGTENVGAALAVVRGEDRRVDVEEVASLKESMNS